MTVYAQLQLRNMKVVELVSSAKQVDADSFFRSRSLLRVLLVLGAISDELRGKSYRK